MSRIHEGGEWGTEETRRLVEKAAALSVEPSPSARARVWSRLEARRRPRIWRLAWGMFAMGAVSALAAMLLVARHPVSSDPSALVIASDGSTRMITRGERLPLSPELALVDLHGAGRLVEGADTVAKLVRYGADGVELRLERGSLLAHVTPRPAGAPFVVRTPRFTARVVGTVLRVAVHADGASSLVVAHGVVEVQPLSGPPLLVRAGDRWPVDSTDSPDDAELARLGAGQLEGVSPASFAPPAAPSALSPLHDESSLYAAGDRALKEAHDPRAALGLWEEQRRRFPTGVLRRDADASIVDALVALKQPGRALAEVDALLAVDPAGLRADELHFVRGTLLRAVDGNCRRARTELDRALQRPSDPWAARARAARAACKETR